MNTDSDIWLAFARTFGMLFLVLAALLLVFYLVRRFTAGQGGSASPQLIRVLAVHHISPKEKLVLVKVLDQTVLIGVTPSNISGICNLESGTVPEDLPEQGTVGFARLLRQALGKSPQRGADHGK